MDHSIMIQRKKKGIDSGQYFCKDMGWRSCEYRTMRSYKIFGEFVNILIPLSRNLVARVNEAVFLWRGIASAPEV